MQLVDFACRLPAPNEMRDWPLSVKEIMSTLDDAFPPLLERRKVRRFRYRAAGQLKIQHDRLGTVCTAVYTRDVNQWHAGVITDRPLEIGQPSELELRFPDGSIRRVDCTVRRCREFHEGWYECTIHFVYEVPDLHLGR